MARVSARMQLGWASACFDAVAMVGSYLAAAAIRASMSSAIGTSSAEFAPDWSVVVFVAVAVSVFYVSGLYEPEAYVSRPLHLWTLLKASLATFAVSAVLFFVIRSSAFDESRLVLLMTLPVFVLFVCVLRLGVLDGLSSAWLRQRKPVTLLVGESETVRELAERLGHLRGFDRVERVAPATLRPTQKKRSGPCSTALGRRMHRSHRSLSTHRA